MSWHSVWVVGFHQNDFLEINILVFVFAFAKYSCKVVNLALFRCGVCPVASKSTVYLLCIALLLLPAHVCLGFWDRSPGPTDHTCRECELRTRPVPLDKNREKQEIVVNSRWRNKYSKLFWIYQMCIKKIFGCTKLSNLLHFKLHHTDEVMSCHL